MISWKPLSLTTRCRGLAIIAASSILLGACASSSSKFDRSIPEEKDVSEEIRNSDEYKIGNLLQIHSYALEKGDWEWFMSTYDESKFTSYKSGDVSILGWKEIKKHIQDLIKDSPGLKLTRSGLKITRISVQGQAQRSFATGDQEIRDPEGNLLSSGEFRIVVKESGYEWKIISEEYWGK